MSGIDYLEAMLLLLPPEAGGRAMPVAPRDGSYRPFARAGGQLGRVRVIEGPPLLAPGDEARVVVEVESSIGGARAGAEVELLEHGERLVGILTIIRVCRRAIA